MAAQWLGAGSGIAAAMRRLAVGEEAEVAAADEALRQDMDEEAAKPASGQEGNPARPQLYECGAHGRLP